MNAAEKIDAAESDNIQVELIFPTHLYVIDKPSFLPAIRPIIAEYIAQHEKEHGSLHELYPARMGDAMQYDPRLQDFCGYVGRTGFDILIEQGVDMRTRRAYFSAMWVQEHYKHSMMEQHVHGEGAQLVGFYFIDTPEKGSVATFFDPRAGKVSGQCREADTARVTYASNAINFMPRPGALVFTNAWLPHAFTRHGTEVPFRFIHFNINVTEEQQDIQCEALPQHQGSPPTQSVAAREVEVIG